MPPAAIAAVAVVGSIASGVAGKQAGAGAAGRANDAANIAFQKLEEVGLPPDTARAIVYHQFEQQGLMTPELESHIDQKTSEMGQVKDDPTVKAAQMNALQILSQRGKGGLNPEDRAALNEVRNKIATDTEAKRQQILQNFQSRGQAGGGAELIAALQGAQSGANSEAAEGDKISAQASQNALQAIGQAGTLGGQIRGQDFSEEAQKAQAQDVINQFNTQNQIGQQSRNVAATNAAKESNLANAQNIANANTQQENQELLRQNDAKRQEWVDTMSRAQAQGGAANTLSNQQSALSQSQSAQAAAPYAAIGAAGMSAATSMMNKKWNGGEIGYDEGGEVDKSFADKLSDYFASKPVQPQHVDSDKAKQVSDSFKSAFADGGDVEQEDPQLSRLRRIFPTMNDQALKDIHMKANPELPPRMSDGGGVRQPDEHQRRLGITDYRTGGHVPGQAPVAGDSPKNDIVDAKLSPGEYVIKRSQAKSPFGKKLIKLLEAHSEVMKHAPKDD